MSEKEVFEKIYEQGEAMWTRTGPPSYLVEFIEKGEIKPCKAIDVGCGEGFVSIYLAKEGFEMTGIDFSKKAIELAKQNAQEQGVKINFFQMDLKNIHELKEKFDFVIEKGILHCVDPKDWKKYIKDVANILNPRGKYLSVCFNEQSPAFGGQNKKYRISPVGNKLYFPSEKELRKLFEQYFKMIEYRLIEIHSKKGGDHTVNLFLLEKSGKN